MKKFSILSVTLMLCVSMFASVAFAYDPVVIGGAYQVQLLDVTYNPGTNLQNWTYRITGIETPAVSHALFEFKKVCDPPLSSIDGAGPVTTEISTGYDDADPTTGKVGIKFENFFTGDGSIEPGEYADVWFTLVGEWPVGTIEVWIKAGSEVVVSGIVNGPECRLDNNIPEIPFGTIMAATSMIVALAAYTVYRKRK